MSMSLRQIGRYLAFIPELEADAMLDQTFVASWPWLEPATRKAHEEEWTRLLDGGEGAKRLQQAKEQKWKANWARLRSLVGGGGR